MSNEPQRRRSLDVLARDLIRIRPNYGFGLAWLLSGIVTGWLNWSGHPAGVALWLVTGAAVWPWFVFKILRDLSRGIQTTDLQ